MKKPVSKSISLTFSFSNSDFKRYSIPLLFKDLQLVSWNDFDKLVEITNNQTKKLTDQQALEKWKKAFETIETNFRRNVAVASYAGKMAEYLDDENGINEFLAAQHKKKMKHLNNQEKHTKERVQKKLRVEMFQEMETQIDHSSPSYVSSPQIPKSKSISIKRVIFSEGKRLHDSYKQGNKLEPKKRHRMAAGLSGILDLTNDNRNTQASLFDKEDWTRIKTCYLKKHKIEPSPLEDWVTDKWNYISEKCVEKGDILYGRKFVDRLCGSETISNYEYNTYKFFDSILDIIQNSQHVLNPAYPEKILENDFTFTVWMPLLTRLFNINTNTIRIKPGESIPVDSTSEMSYIYGDDNKNLLGFKVDLRFIYDFEDQEYDLCNLECSREDANDQKIYHDHSKLIREGKTNVISLFNTTVDIPNVYTWIIHACGLKLYISTVIYVGEDLFVVVPQFNINFPTVIGQLKSFVIDIKYLFTFMKDIERLAHASAAVLHRARNDRKGKSVQRMNKREYSLSPPPGHCSVPGTVNWHAPPRNNAFVSRIPLKNIDAYGSALDTHIDSHDDCSDNGDNIDKSYNTSTTSDDEEA